MHDGNARRTGVILGVAAAGLLLGHWLTYLLDVPSHARDQALQATGHGYLATAGRLAAVTAAVSLAIVFLGRLTRREPGAPFIAVAGRLAAVQISAFVAMEVLERLGAGAPMHDLTTILPVGVAAQAGRGPRRGMVAAPGHARGRRRRFAREVAARPSFLVPSGSSRPPCQPRPGRCGSSGAPPGLRPCRRDLKHVLAGPSDR